MRRPVLQTSPPGGVLLALLLVLQLGVQVLAVCPPLCSCSSGHREVDCSRRGLRQLPLGLQHNLRSLNLSHNRLHGLGGQLTGYAHLRVLDLSHNRLSRIPPGLPRSLWQLYASANHIQLLEKNDTAYQWNLRLLDLSHNKLERAIFINNTLTNLHLLNLSGNHFWTVPTNLPTRLETVDLSHNSLVQALPGSLDRLPLLTHFFLHANRFSALPPGAFDKLTGLRLITLGDNPWACHLHTNISYLLSWLQQTPARIVGCPCQGQAVCGEVRPVRTGGWHFGSYNLPPLAARANDLSSAPPDSSTASWWFVSVSALLNSQHSTVETSETQYDPSTVSLLHPSTLPHRTPIADLSTELLSITAHPSTADHMFPEGPGSVGEAGTPLTTAEAVIDTPDDADWTLTAEPPSESSTTQSVLIATKKTTTLRTRSVRRPNQSLDQSLASGTSPTPTPQHSLISLRILWCLTLILQQVL